MSVAQIEMQVPMYAQVLQRRLEKERSDAAARARVKEDAYVELLGQREEELKEERVKNLVLLSQLQGMLQFATACGITAVPGVYTDGRN